MKTTQWVTGLLVAAVMAFTGCGKKATAGGEESSPSARFAQFREVFQTPTPEQQQVVAKVSMGIRYRTYADAVAALEQLSTDASLNDAQKKAVTNLIESIKKMAASAPPAPQ